LYLDVVFEGPEMGKLGWDMLSFRTLILLAGVLCVCTVTG